MSVTQVTTPGIADINVTTPKLADGSVTNAKLASDSVTTAKILDANVTNAKLASGAVTPAKVTNDTYAISISGNAATSTSATNATTANNGAKAWVAFNSAGVRLNQYNVSSVTWSGGGSYRVNYTTNLGVDVYATVVTGSAPQQGLLYYVPYIVGGSFNYDGVNMNRNNVSFWAYTYVGGGAALPNFTSVVVFA